MFSYLCILLLCFPIGGIAPGGPPRIDICAGINCRNGKTCQQGFCKCPVLFSGFLCKTKTGPICPKCNELTSTDPDFLLPDLGGNTCSLNPEVKQCNVGERCETITVTTSFSRPAGSLTLTLTSRGCEQHSELSRPIGISGCVNYPDGTTDVADSLEIEQFRGILSPELVFKFQKRNTCVCHLPINCGQAFAGEENCEDPGTPDFGIRFGTFDHGHILTFECNPGYILKGAHHIICGNGNYSEDIPVCEDECDKIDCLNGGTCEQGSCTCPAGFAGLFCQDKLTSVKCGSSSMTVKIDARLVPGDASGVHFRNLSCCGVNASTNEITLTTDYSQCGTTFEEDNTTITFTNVITYAKPGSEDGTEITLAQRMTQLLSIVALDCIEKAFLLKHLPLLEITLRCTFTVQ
eukprot:XP_011661240.1 PREDICTED: neurogenic locus notch homolog protein 2-like [Strongylocentrotus purpuratus]